MGDKDLRKINWVMAKPSRRAAPERLGIASEILVEGFRELNNYECVNADSILNGHDGVLGY